MTVIFMCFSFFDSIALVDPVILAHCFHSLHAFERHADSNSRFGRRGAAVASE